MSPSDKPKVMPSSLSAGNDILSYCTSCKMDLNHTIVAVQSGRVIRVLCRTCKKTHGFRPPKGAKSPVSAVKRESSPRARTVGVGDEWRARKESLGKNPGVSYSPKTSFAVGSKVLHPSFGEGYVEKLIPPNKMEVLFQSDLKVLIHAGAPKTERPARR